MPLAQALIDTGTTTMISSTRYPPSGRSHKHIIRPRRWPRPSTVDVLQLSQHAAKTITRQGNSDDCWVGYPKSRFPISISSFISSIAFVSVSVCGVSIHHRLPHLFFSFSPSLCLSCIHLATLQALGDTPRPREPTKGLRRGRSRDSEGH